MGAYTPFMFATLGVYLPIYPVKGYFATSPIISDEASTNMSLTDSEKKVVFTRLGDKMRVDGTAEFTGYDTSLKIERCTVLVDLTRKVFPKGLALSKAEFWTGLRPATPGNVPLIGR